SAAARAGRAGRAPGARLARHSRCGASGDQGVRCRGPRGIGAPSPSASGAWHRPGRSGESQASCPMARSVRTAPVLLLRVQSDGADWSPVAGGTGPPAWSGGPGLRIDAVSRSEDGPVAPFVAVVRSHEANAAV